MSEKRAEESLLRRHQLHGSPGGPRAGSHRGGGTGGQHRGHVRGGSWPSCQWLHHNLFNQARYYLQVGEHSMWAKYTAFELAHRAPMMIHVPGIIDQVNYDYYEKASNLYLLVNVF